MFRIDSDGVTESIPTPEAAGVASGYFQKGNPSTGTKATEVSADWLNAVQEELLNVIAATNITPSKTNRAQLLSAIKQVSTPLAPGAYNLGISYSGGTFTVHHADGSALSTSNPAFVVMRSNVTTGNLCIHTLTANQSFIDDAGSSNIIGEEFGTTAGVAWANSRPFALYAVSDSADANCTIALSPNPAASHSPALAANNGYKGSPAATPSDNNFFYFTSSNVTATHNNKICQLIGAIAMTKSSADDWTYVSSTADGIMRFDMFGKTLFTMPKGQMGANSGKYIWDNTGTAPTFTGDDIYTYTIDLNGWVEGHVLISNSAGGTVGVGAVLALLILPYAVAQSSKIIGHGTMSNSGSHATLCNVSWEVPGYIAALYYQSTIITAVSGINNGDFSNAGRGISLALSFKAF